VVGGEDFDGRAEGKLEIESPTSAVAHLITDTGAGGEICSLALAKTSGKDASITVTNRTGDCSFFALPGASFEHQYAFRAKTPFYWWDIPLCFLDESRARAAFCTSKTLSKQGKDWISASQSLAESGGPDFEREDVALAKVFKSCDAAEDAGACLSKAFDTSALNRELWKREDEREAAVTEPGDPNTAKRIIQKIQGTYRSSAGCGDFDHTAQCTDKLVIRRVSDTAIHVDVVLHFFMGGTCAHHGVATYRRGGSFVHQVKNEDGDLCIFEVIPTSKGITLGDSTRNCRADECCMRGGYDGAEFSWRDKVKGASRQEKVDK